MTLGICTGSNEESIILVGVFVVFLELMAVKHEHLTLHDWVLNHT